MKILKCLAWVIGINKYMYYPDLHAAVNDATEFADKLEQLGYSVVRSIDDGHNQEGTYKHVLEKQQIFLDKILEDKVDVALVYFAGHGLMINKEDCLILSDTDSCKDGIVKARGNSINLNVLCKDMNANGDQMNLLIMDACRVKAENDRGWAGNDGFGSYTKLPFQSFFAFSTSPETSATDGSIHSPYTQLLLDKMMEKDLPIESLFKSIRYELRKTGRKQIGQELTSLVYPYSFNYGQLEDGASLNYSEYALADANYLSTNGAFLKCLELFKSYNYYKQIDAIDMFHQEFKQMSEDDKFVIGRNILQAAVGGCWKCEEELTYSKLKLYNNKGNNAVLDGILYEMYFNSYNEFRNQKVKGIGFLSQIDKLSLFDEFENSFKNIRKVLSKYRETLEYLPGDKEQYTVKVNLESQGKTDFDDMVWEIDNISYKNVNILDKLHISHDTKKGDLRQKLCDYLAIPSSKLKVDGLDGVEDTDILCPKNDIELLLATI